MGFSILTFDILNWVIFLFSGCVLCFVECLAASLAAYPLDASSTAPNCDNQDCLQALPSVPWGHDSSLLRTTSLGGLTLKTCAYGDYASLTLYPRRLEGYLLEKSGERD